jgi:hypothetical protein
MHLLNQKYIAVYERRCVFNAQWQGHIPEKSAKVLFNLNGFEAQHNGIMPLAG